MTAEERKEVDKVYDKLRADGKKAEWNGAKIGGIGGILFGSIFGTAVWTSSHTLFYYYLVAIIVAFIVISYKSK